MLNAGLERCETGRDVKLNQFQEYMRSNSLGSGTIVSYRRYLGKLMDESGVITVDPETLSGNEKSAWNKWVEHRSVAKKDGDDE